MSDQVLRDRIVELLRRWPGGATTGNAIENYAVPGRYRTRLPALLDSLTAEGVIERCEFAETAYSTSGSYRRTFQGYRLTAGKEASCPR